jgi:hypothetical protein
LYVAGTFEEAIIPVNDFRFVGADLPELPVFCVYDEVVFSAVCDYAWNSEDHVSQAGRARDHM